MSSYFKRFCHGRIQTVISDRRATGQSVSRGDYDTQLKVTPSLLQLLTQLIDARFTAQVL